MFGFGRNKTQFVALAMMLALFAPAFAAAQVSWAKNFSDALKQAAQEDKHIILDISATW